MLTPARQAIATASSPPPPAPTGDAVTAAAATRPSAPSPPRRGRPGRQLAVRSLTAAFAVAVGLTGTVAPLASAADAPTGDSAAPASDPGATAPDPSTTTTTTSTTTADSVPAPAPPTTTVTASAPPPAPATGAPLGPYQGTTPSLAQFMALPGAHGTILPRQAPAGPSVAPQIGSQHAQAVTGAKPAAPTDLTGTDATTTADAAKKAASDLQTANALAAAIDPSALLAALGAVGSGVPDFFVDKFSIPAFLLPIYRAAGIEYDVPWQVLAAINEVETDYGRNLAVSSAGAVGWMQFLPSAWAKYGVDANGDGLADPDNPVDAIFTAARYLHAAGASQSLRRAISTYNDASWYADSVMLRAKLIGGIPDEMVSTIAGLADGLFPVHATVRYADTPTPTPPSPATRPSPTTGPQQAGAAGAATATATSPQPIDIYAVPGSPVVAVRDGVITSITRSPELGYSIGLRDASGNAYVYSDLKRVAANYAAAKPIPATPAATATPATAAPGGARPPSDPSPAAAASAGHQTAVNAPGPAVSAPVPPATVGPALAPARPASDAGAITPRLFAQPRPQAAFAAGGRLLVSGQAPADLPGYLVRGYGLRRTDVELRPLRPGARVIAGTVLGRVGARGPGRPSRIGFQIRPAGTGAPLIDAKPVLDAWRLLESTTETPSAPVDASFGPAAGNPRLGEVLLLTQAELQQRILTDPSVVIPACSRNDIAAGLIDQRILVVIAYLSAAGLEPTVSELHCGGKSPAAAAFDPLGSTVASAAGAAVDISAINGSPIATNTPVTAAAVRQLETLQGRFKPSSILDPSTPSLPSGAPAPVDHIHVEFTPQYAPDQPTTPVLTAKQWPRLIARLIEIRNPTVTTVPSTAAIPTP